MPLRDLRKHKASLEELGKACVIASKRATTIAQAVPEIMKDVNDAMASFNNAFVAIKRAHTKLVALEKGVLVEDQEPA